ncbi:MAG: BN159_2729 family protein [Streptomyces sp.]|nr:BN159_2729 family protein [Streptomyces sp.]
MNKSIPHAVKVIRAAIASSGADPAAAIAHALDGARLLVDPERSFGAVLRRTPASDWAREHPDHTGNGLPVGTQTPPRTELEEQAAAWDESCARARRVADDIRRRLAGHSSVRNVQVDRDQVLVALYNVTQEQWGQWRLYFGITHDKEAETPYMVAGDGYRDGVRVGVVAYDLPEARKLAKQIARAPFEFEGIVYDLALPQRDSRGEVWFYQGEQATGGMPLLSQDGRPERCTLASIVRHAGPLTPVTSTPSTQVGPVMTGGEHA